MKRIIAALVILSSSASGRLQDDAILYERTLNSVVWICTLDKDWEESSGTGVVVGEGQILTAYHVVKDEALVWAHAPERDDDGQVINTPQQYRAKDESSMRCVMVASDPERDLALLVVRRGEKRGIPMKLARQSPVPGQQVFTIGNGSSVLFRYSGGNVKAVFDDTASFSGQEVKARMVEMTVPINSGDSGGPLMNSKGEMVGINSYIETDKNQVHKSIDVSEIRKFLDSWRK